MDRNNRPRRVIPKSLFIQKYCRYQRPIVSLSGLIHHHVAINRKQMTGPGRDKPLAKWQPMEAFVKISE